MRYRVQRVLEDADLDAALEVPLADPDDGPVETVDLDDPQHPPWPCERCRHINPDESFRCQECGNPNPDRVW